MIRISGLAKRFGSLEVLQHIDLEMTRGRVTAVVGPNGAGKTTLIKAVLGLTRGDSGSILVDGERIGSDPSYRARHATAADRALPENLTGSELMRMLKDRRGTSATLTKHGSPTSRSRLH